MHASRFGMKGARAKLVGLEIAILAFFISLAICRGALQLPESTDVSRTGHTGGRRGLQAQMGDWRVIPVLDFGGFYNAALEASDANARIQIIVGNHIVANAMSLNTIIRGHLWITSNCTGIPKIPSKSHKYMDAIYNQPYENMCQFFLNQFSTKSPRFSLNASQVRSDMSGLPFFSVSETGSLLIEDTEIAGCYSLSGGACVRLGGGSLKTVRSAFTAAYSATIGGAIYAYIPDGGQSWPKVELQYTVFTDNKAVAGADNLYFSGEPSSLSALPNDTDTTGWQVLYSVPAFPPSPPQAPPLPPPPPFPPLPSPPPPVPGNYEEYMGDTGLGSSVIDALIEDAGIELYIGLGVGAAGFLCCFLVTVCHILITCRLCCFKNVDEDTDTIAGKLVKQHSNLMRATSFTKERSPMRSPMRSLSRGLSNLSFRKRQKSSHIDNDYSDDEADDPKLLAVMERKKMLISESSKNLRQALDNVEQISIMDGTADITNYKADAWQHGAHVGAFKAPMKDIKPPKAAAVPPTAEMLSLGLTTSNQNRPMDLPEITSYWGPPSLGATFAKLPKADRHAGPLDRRREQREARGMSNMHA